MGNLERNGYSCNSGLNVNMVKVSISLPNSAQITFESEESEVLREIIALVLRDLPRDLMQPNALKVEGVSTEKSTYQTQEILSATSLTEPFLSPIPEKPQPKPEPFAVAAPPEPINDQTVTDVSISPEFLSSSGRAAFKTFCQNANPLGDMRRVVVAAEGATRHFGIEGVNATDLGWLFDVAGWRRPGNFTQTLRNAARSKFGWLERIPGRSGRYTATPLGVSKTISII